MVKKKNTKRMVDLLTDLIFTPIKPKTYII